MNGGYTNDDYVILCIFLVKLNNFLINQNIRSDNKILPNTETVSDLSKCEQEV